MPPRFFFDQDCDSHWYMVPVSMRSVWEEMTVNDPVDDESIDAFLDTFEIYRLDGGISHITFAAPEEA